MIREDSKRRITDLPSDVSDQAMKNWLEYAKNLDRSSTEMESEIFGHSCAELALIRQHQGVETAAVLLNCGEKFAFDYFELRGAAEFLKEGWPLERVSDHTVENGCDPALEAMEEPRAALGEFQSGGWDTREDKWKFSPDLSQEIRQFYVLEQGLGGQNETFSEWIRAAYEINEDFDQSFTEVVSGFCDAFHDTDAQYGRDISRQLYSTLAVVLPAEIRSVAQCLSLGGSPDHVPALALVGPLMESQNHDNMLQAVEHMNDGGGAENAYYATQGKAFKGHSPQHQQTM